MRRKLRIAFGSCLLSAALFNGFADLFMWSWRATTAGQPHDIAARGPFLLAVYLPMNVAIALLTAGALGTALTRGSGLGLRTRLALALAGACLGPLLAVLDVAALGALTRSAHAAPFPTLVPLLIYLLFVGGGLRLLRQAVVSVEARAV